jgi:hypothetical protein
LSLLRYQEWIEAESRLKGGNTIDKLEKLLIQKESERWKNLLTRLMNITVYLAENNMAFQGSSNKLYTHTSGKYLGLVQLLAKFDPVMQEHVSHILKGELGDHYCRKNILSKLIELMTERVNSKLISCAQNAKYFSIIANCTSDISHVEQLFLMTRFVDLTNENADAEICERFLGFTSVDVSTVKGLSDVTLKSLEKNKLELKHCRGQGYDNGANIKGKNSGVQK